MSAMFALRASCLGLAVLTAQFALAQGSGVVPTFSASTTYADNRGNFTGEEDRQFVTQLSPGFQWSSRHGRLQGAVDYQLTATFYSNQAEANNHRNSLAAKLTGEPIENWLFVDALASIGQEAISPFDRPVTSGFAANDNAAEVRMFSLSPYVRGKLLGAAVYEVRWTAVRTRGASVVGANSDSDTALVSVSSASAARLGWTVQATKQNVDFGSGANSSNDRINAQLNWATTDELRLGLTGGQESTDVVGGARRTYGNWGWTLRWTPTPRTDLSVLSERRYFGNSHSLSFTHRMRRSTLIYTDTRGADNGGGAAGLGQPVSLYSLYFELFAAQEPNPALRDQLVRNYLRAIGQDPSSLVSGGFLTSAVTLQRRQNLALAIQGVRTNISLQAFRGDTSQLQTTGSNLQDALPVRQAGFVASLSYRLSPVSSVSLSATQQRTASTGVQPESDTKSVSLAYSSALGPSVSASFALRYTEFDSLSNPYRESAATASLSVRF